MPIQYFAKADSVEFLDLCAPEFHETRNTKLIYALDLSVAPQRYCYPSRLSHMSRYDTIMHLRRLFQFGYYRAFDHFDNKLACSSRKLIEIARSKEGGSYPELSFFSNFIIKGFESSPRNCESERIRLYLKYMKVYCRYVAESIIVVFKDSRNIILTFERPPVVLDTHINSSFVSQIKNRVSRKLMLMLFESNSSDSSLVAEIFRAICKDETKMKLLFGYEANVTEYLLHHLKEEKAELRHLFKTLQLSSRHCSLLQSNPEHLLVLLNYGLKIKITRNVEFTQFLQLYPSYKVTIYRGNLAILRGEWSDLNPREAAILDILAHSLTFKAPHFAIYLESLRYIWRSIPDPFITYQEMRTLLLRIADTIDVEDTCSNLQKWKFDCFDTILQPRSLRHYSRCVIRDSLASNSEIPEGIKFLGLPSRLKSYLRLEF